jgi:hypothetical protein
MELLEKLFGYYVEKWKPFIESSFPGLVANQTDFDFFILLTGKFLRIFF